MLVLNSEEMGVYICMYVCIYGCRLEIGVGNKYIPNKDYLKARNFDTTLGD